MTLSSLKGDGEISYVTGRKINNWHTIILKCMQTKKNKYSQENETTIRLSTSQPRHIRKDYRLQADPYYEDGKKGGRKGEKAISTQKQEHRRSRAKGRKRKSTFREEKKDSLHSPEKEVKEGTVWPKR